MGVGAAEELGGERVQEGNDEGVELEGRLARGISGDGGARRGGTWKGIGVAIEVRLQGLPPAE